MKKWFEVDFEPGDIVYLKTDDLSRPYMVTGYCVRQGGTEYELAQGSVKTWHYSFEMSKEPVKFLNGIPKDSE